MDLERHSMIAKKACTRCATQKRKCDRQLPRCGLCTRLRQKCSYELPGSASSLPRPSPSLGLETSLSPRAFTSSYVLDTIVQRLGHLTPEDVLSAYCRSIEPWFPIISIPRLRDRLPIAWNEAELDVALLCLSIVVLTTIPPTCPEIENDPSELRILYFSTKSSIALIEGLGINSFLIVQSRILVTLFEVAHGYYPAAFISIGAAIRAADALETHVGIDSSRPRSVDEEEKREYTVLTWCGILVLDRYIAVESGRHPSLTHTRSEMINGILKQTMCPTYQQCQDRTDAIFRLSRFVETSSLLDNIHASLHHFVEGVPFDFDAFVLTVKALVALQTTMNNEIGKNVSIYENGLALCQIALCLAFDDGSKVPLVSGVTENCMSIATNSLISVLSFVTTSLEPFIMGDQSIDFNLLPPFIMLLVHKAAAIITERLLMNIDPIDGMKQLKILRHFLKIVWKRWLGAGRLLKLLDEDTTPRILKAVEQ